VKEPNHRVPEQARILTSVEPPLEFVGVTVQMFRGNLMIGTNDRSLKQAPNVFDVVGVHVSTDPFLFAVVDRLVLEPALRRQVSSPGRT
jgi:hypothetical protein